ncbi:hypothetical protein HK405_006105, partial [Cladochytrium tenue]
ATANFSSLATLHMRAWAPTVEEGDFTALRPPLQRDERTTARHVLSTAASSNQPERA